ncbi:MAG: M15 family metallopeptidase [Defluviitaleaceae bacterium]|nr:M15 family metallopeptidase [Defluviitaleaceae bacterium]
MKKIMKSVICFVFFLSFVGCENTETFESHVNQPDTVYENATDFGLSSLAENEESELLTPHEIFDTPEAFVPPLAEISSYGRQASKDFLIQMPTLFRDSPVPVTGIREPWEWGFELEEGQFSLGLEFIDGNWQNIITYEIPELYFRRDRDADGNRTENHGFFDNHGNRIENVSWILGDYYATRFRLWDFDHSGIPVITVYYEGNWTDVTANKGVQGSIFKYADGEFVRVSAVREAGAWQLGGWPSLHTEHTDAARFYFDYNGNLIRSDGVAGGGYFVWFDYFLFAENEMILTSMSSYGFGRGEDSVWSNFVTGETNIPIGNGWGDWDWNTLYRLPGLSMNIPLTQIEPLTELANEIKTDLAMLMPTFTQKPIPEERIEFITGLSFRYYAPFTLDALRYLSISYVNFSGESRVGNLIVAAEIADEVLDIFREIYEARFPIYGMRLIDYYNALDYYSMAANNSHAFNFRYIANTRTLSRHAFGMAIDINPIQNPYVRGENVLPEAGRAYLDRDDIRPGMITRGDVVYTAFISRGWTWGGNWTSLRDYHHFERR